MTPMLVCAVLLLAGLVAGGAWSRLDFRIPDSNIELTPTAVAKRFAWYVSLVLTGGILAGITMIGAGGRLAMRLLAVTGGDSAQGRTTEAGETVGEITVDGTVGFVVFNGIFGGIVAGALYLLVRRFLPARWLGGATFGLGLLIVAGTTIDPAARGQSGLRHRRAGLAGAARLRCTRRCVRGRAVRFHGGSQPMASAPRCRSTRVAAVPRPCVARGGFVPGHRDRHRRRCRRGRTDPFPAHRRCRPVPAMGDRRADTRGRRPPDRAPQRRLHLRRHRHALTRSP